jgi:SMC interacting uncharacterized protein involved in chromosome segregation
LSDNDDVTALLKEIARLKEENKRLALRIRNQRMSLRANWEVVEMRRKWLGSDVARAGYVRLLKENRALRERLTPLSSP